jgi:hypothetical protein
MTNIVVVGSGDDAMRLQSAGLASQPIAHLPGYDVTKRV